MSRLKKTAKEVDEVVMLLDRIVNNVEDIKNDYYVLLENLNALNKDYVGIYNELKVMVKLPNKNTITDISNLKNDIDYAMNMLKDENFLSGFIK